MSYKSPPAKLTIGSLDDEKLNVIAQYNPAQIDLSRTAGWKAQGADVRPGARREKKDARDVEFTGGEGRIFSLELLFDGYENNRSVRAQIDDLDKLATSRLADSTDEDKRRPHQCVIVWGGKGSKDGGGFRPVRCVIDSLAVKYTMFDEDGVPLRAIATVKLREANVWKQLDKEEDEKRFDERARFSLEAVRRQQERSGVR